MSPSPPRGARRLRLAWFLARRYLTLRGQGRFLSFVTWVSLGGVTVGVTALVVVIGVMTGMQNELRRKILGSTPHAMVRQIGPSLRLDEWEEVVERIEAVDGVVAAAPTMFTRVALLHSDYVDVMDLYGVETERAGPSVTEMEDSLRAGRLSLDGASAGPTPVVLGSGLAARMGILVGDTVSVISVEGIQVTPNGDPTTRVEEWVVSGVFSSGHYDFDHRNGYATLAAVQDLLAMERSAASFVGVRADDPWRAAETSFAVAEALGGWPYVVDPWTETNRHLFSALKLEKLAMGVIVSLIVFVAAFNVVSALVMVVVSRTREIGILKAMGLTARDTRRVFVLQGVWIGVVGTGAGLGLGLLLALLVDEFGLIRLPPEVYFVDRLPVSLSPVDLLWIAGTSLAIALVATIYPSRRAAALEPVDAIRHE